MPVDATTKRTKRRITGQHTGRHLDQHLDQFHPVPALVLAARRKKLLSKLAPNSIAVFVSNPEATRSNDTEFKYRQSSNLIYLSGFLEPESAVMLCNIAGVPQYSLFVRPKDRAREIWTGIRQGVEGAKANYHCDAAYTNDQFAEVLSKLAPKTSNLYHRLGNNSFFDDQFFAVWQGMGYAGAAHAPSQVQDQGAQKMLSNPEEIINEMRLHKDKHELDLMGRAAQLSASAHCLAMRACRPGMYEYQLAAILEANYLYNACAAPAYNSIVAGGPNAVVLHYESNDCKLNDGDLVLIDAAGEYQGYASDITRTFPVNGKFSEAQREVYELVLSAQLAAIGTAKPGVRLADVHNAACAVLEKGLGNMGILPPWTKATRRIQKSESVRNSREFLTLKSFYMHGTSHWLGLDVHDVGDYKTATGTRSDEGPGKQRILEPGMVITVEPGLYFDAADKRIPAPYRGMGIRIEDDVVITRTGNRVLSDGVPKMVDEIEKLMSDHASWDQVVCPS